MGEHRAEVTETPSGVGSAFFSLVIGPERNASAVVYGIITVGAVLAAEGNRNETYLRSVGAAVLVLLLYWVVHAWSQDSGSRLAERRAFAWAPFAEALRDEWSIMRGASVPILSVIIAGLSGATDRRAVFVGTLVAAVMLVVFELSVAVRGRLSPKQVAVQAAAGALFGMALIGLRFVVV